MASHYSVVVYDEAGEFDRFTCETFVCCLSMFADARRAYPRKVVAAFNLDRNDYDTDGLTDAERDALDEVA